MAKTVDDARPYHHGDLRRALIDAALQILEEEQNWEFTLRELARRAGVSHAAPYKHFADKRELLAEVAAVGFERLKRDMEVAAVAHPDDPSARLAAIGEAYVEFALRSPAHFRLMFGPAHQDEANKTSLPQAAAGTFAALRDAVREAGGGAGEQDRSLAAWALVHGLATLLIDQRIPGVGDDRNAQKAIVANVLAAFRVQRGR